MNRFVVLLSLIFIYNFSFAQSISLNVKDKKKEPLIGATIKITNVKDSTKQMSVTDIDGKANLQVTNNQLYKLNISYIGFQNFEKVISFKEGKMKLDIEMKEDNQSLGEVVIQAKRPLITQEDDKMIIDPEPIASISTNTLEILEKTPGLFVDQDGNIYLNSATPAVVYINGKEQKMSTQDIATILKSLPPSSIQKIEVLRTPSTKYDAASSGGIVNVILKKGVKIGQTGSINFGGNQGYYGNQFIGGNFNNSGEKTTYYVSANYSQRDALETLNSNRYFTSDSLLNQSASTRNKAKQIYLGFGGTYDLTKKFELSYDGRVNTNLPNPTTTNWNTLHSGQNIQSQYYNSIDNNAKSISFQNDFGTKYKFDSLGSELVTNFNYNFYRNDADQNYGITRLLPTNSSINGFGNNLQQRNFFMLQSDLTYFFPHKIKLETGMKSTFQKYNSNANYYISLNNNNVSDPSRTNAFNYTENINSVYLQGSKTFWEKFILKVGMRMEHTYMNGNQTIPSDTSFLVSRVDLFPYLYLSRSLFKINTYDMRGYLIYRRSINRPNYENLNPYIKYVDQFLYETGNPSLKPQFTDNYEANISFQDYPIFAIGQNYTTDIFSNVVYQDKTLPNVAVKTYDNLGKNKETYFRFAGALPPGGKYFFVAGAQYNLNEYSGIYEGKPLTFNRGSWRFFTFHSLKLFPHTKLTMHGFIMMNGQQNFYELQNFGQLSFGLNQELLNGKLNINLNMNDVLRTMKVQFSLNQGSILSNGERYSDNQRIGLSVRYNFGIKRKEEKPGMFNNDEN